MTSWQCDMCSVFISHPLKTASPFPARPRQGANSSYLQWLTGKYDKQHWDGHTGPRHVLRGYGSTISVTTATPAPPVLHILGLYCGQTVLCGGLPRSDETAVPEQPCRLTGPASEVAAPCAFTP